MSSCFASCSSLTSVIFNSINSNVTQLSGVFSGCTSLVTAPNFTISGTTTMSYKFSGCTLLENVPEYNTSRIFSPYAIQSIFGNCPNLTDTSLNNILNMCRKSGVTSNKTLKWIGLSQSQATRCQSLSNYSAFINAGWTTGY